MVVLAVRLLPHDNEYHDLKSGISSTDILRGMIDPTKFNTTWASGKHHCIVFMRSSDLDECSFSNVPI